MLKIERNNPRQLVAGKAVYGPIREQDACFYCNKLMKAGTKAVTVNLINEDLMLWSGGRGRIHICWKCYIADRGPWTRYPPLKNPAILPEVKEIVKREPAVPCQLCDEEVKPGDSCISIKIIQRNIYGNSETIYMHIKCWDDPKRGIWRRYPKLYTPHGDNRKMQKDKWLTTPEMFNPRVSKKRAKEITESVISTVSQNF